MGEPLETAALPRRGQLKFFLEHIKDRHCCLFKLLYCCNIVCFIYTPGVYIHTYKGLTPALAPRMPVITRDDGYGVTRNLA